MSFLQSDNCVAYLLLQGGDCVIKDRGALKDKLPLNIVSEINVTIAQVGKKSQATELFVRRNLWDFGLFFYFFYRMNDSNEHVFQNRANPYGFPIIECFVYGT